LRLAPCMRSFPQLRKGPECRALCHFLQLSKNSVRTPSPNVPAPGGASRQTISVYSGGK